MSRPRKATTVDGESLRNSLSINGSELRALIERVEGMNAAIADYTFDRRGIFKEIKAAGYDVATVRAIIKHRATDPEKQRSMDELLEMYLDALGDFASTPLGQAGADRVRASTDVRIDLNDPHVSRVREAAE